MQDLKCNQKEYITSVICNNHLVNVFLDDYGQQYYFQFVDNNGILQTKTCGTYESNYMEQIEHELDYNSWFEKQPDWYKEMVKEDRSRIIKRMMEKPECFSDKKRLNTELILMVL